MSSKERLDTKEEFLLVKQAKSFVHAGRGIWVFLRTTRNAWIHCAVLACVVGLGAYFRITQTEWLFLVLSGGMLITAEAFNTALEIDIDLTSPEYHPYARDTKDVAAGAVFLCAITALIMWIIIFAPYVF